MPQYSYPYGSSNPYGGIPRDFIPVASITGASKITVSPASIMAKNALNVIAGASTITVSPASALSLWRMRAVNGNSVITFNPAATLAFAASRMSATQPSPTFLAKGGGVITALQGNTFASSGAVLPPNTLAVTQDYPTFSGLGAGALNAVQASSFTASASGQVLATLSATQPSPNFAASSIIGSSPTLSVSQTAAFSGSGGGSLTAIQSTAVFSSISTAGVVANLTVTQPAATFSGSGQSYAVTGVLTAVQPAMYANYGGLFVVEPAAMFSAGVSLVTNSVVAYAMNIKTAETTAYTNFGFNFIIRLGFDYYGVKADGLYKLTGATDNGAAISASFRTAQDSYGTTSLKRNAKVYLDSESKTTVKPVIDGVAGVAQPSGYKGHKVSLGRGGVGKFWQMEVANVNGEAMRIGALEMQLDILSRKI